VIALFRAVARLAAPAAGLLVDQIGSGLTGAERMPTS